MKKRTLVVRFVFVVSCLLLVSVLLFYEEESFLGETVQNWTNLNKYYSILPRTATAAVENGDDEDETGNDKDDDSTYLNVRPLGLDHCATIRFRRPLEADSEEESYTVDEAMKILQQQQQEGPKQQQPLRVGLVFVETPDKFVSLSKGVFHLFHFLEFLVIGFTELHRLDQALSSSSTTPSSAASPAQPSISSPTSSSPTFSSLQVPWLYVPLLTPEEICGSARGINCLMLQILFESSLSQPHEQQPAAAVVSNKTKPSLSLPIQIFGVESNDNVLRRQETNGAFAGVLRHRYGLKQVKRALESNDASSMVLPVDKMRADALHHANASDSTFVDMVLFIDRNSCKQASTSRIQKIWTSYIIDDGSINANTTVELPSRRFPREQWHAASEAALGEVSEYSHPLAVEEHSSSRNTQSSREDERVKEPPVNRTVVCYVDRQTTSRRLPDTFHGWLVDYLSAHRRVDFRHLHMEQYSALDQLRLASSCHILLGVHGNGLSHIAWMKPNVGGAVVEFFFDYPFYYDYATLSQLFGLQYLALWNGLVLDGDRIAKRDPLILKETRPIRQGSNNDDRPTRKKNIVTEHPRVVAKRLEVTKIALKRFLEANLLQ